MINWKTAQIAVFIRNETVGNYINESIAMPHGEETSVVKVSRMVLKNKTVAMTTKKKMTPKKTL